MIELILTVVLLIGYGAGVGFLDMAQANRRRQTWTR
jgi:hypothetical protein